MAINLATITPASTKAKNVATEEYVDTSTDAFATSIYYPDTTEIDGGKIRTNTINADRIIAGTSMTAPLISGGTINGGTITGGVINGAVISGVVIKASYLDLDGELEVLTNFRISPSLYNANPSLYSDAVYIESNNEYRIPSMSSVADVGTSFLRSKSVGPLVKSAIGSYDRGNAGNNIKAVKIRPAITLAVDTKIIDAYVVASNCSIGAYINVEFLLGNTVIFTYQAKDNANCSNSANYDLTGSIYNNFGNNASVNPGWPSNTNSTFVSAGISFYLNSWMEVYMKAGDYPNISVDIDGNSPLYSIRVSSIYAPGSLEAYAYGYTTASLSVNNLR